MYYYRKYYLIVYHTSLQLQLSQDCDWTFIFLNASTNTIVKALLLTMLLELTNNRIMINTIPIISAVSMQKHFLP